jgi:hypothetical protein
MWGRHKGDREKKGRERETVRARGTKRARHGGHACNACLSTEEAKAEDFTASLGHIGRPCLEKERK